MDRKAMFEQGRGAMRRGLQARGEGALELAMKEYAEALDLFERSEQPSAAIIALNNMGALMQLRGEVERAAGLYRDALARAEAIGDEEREALSCGNLGALHLDGGDLVRAEILVSRALDLYTRGDIAGGRANQLGNLGLIACARGQMDEARARMSEATGAFLSDGNLIGAGRTLLSFGEFARQQGDRQSALDAFERARSILARAGDRAGLANALRGLGQLALRGGDLEAARAHFERGMELHRSMEDRRGESAAMIDLANIHLQLGALRPALDLQRAAAQLAGQVGAREGMASALLAAAASHLALAELGACQEALEQASLLFEALESDRGRASALGTRARLAIAQGAPSQALKDARLGLELAERAGLVPLEAALKGICAGAAELRGDPAQARALLGEAIALYEAAEAPSGVHNGHLALVELDLFGAALQPDLEETLADPRLQGARAFFEAASDRVALMGIDRLEATIRRCCGDPREAAARLEALALDFEGLDRPAEALAARGVAAEARLQIADPADPVDPSTLATLADEADALGLKIRASRLGLLGALARIAAGDLEGAERALEAERGRLDAMPEPCPSGEALRLDAKARWLAASGRAEEARTVARRAMERYEATGDRVGPRELRQALGIRAEG